MSVLATGLIRHWGVSNLDVPDMMDLATALGGIAAHHRASSTQVALSRVISHPGVCAIPEAGTPQHVRDNFGGLQVRLREDDVLELDAAFPPPPRPVALGVA